MYACLYHRPDAGAADRSVLRACAEGFSPHIEEPSPGLILFDVRGLGRLYGTPARIADAIAGRARPHCPDVRIAVAVNPETAKMAARGLRGVTVIAPGAEARTLGDLPVALLEPSEDLADTLAAWGIRTFAQLAALPERGVAERLGVDGVVLHRRARGIADRPLVPNTEVVVFEAALELDHPLELLEPLSFLLSRLLHDICGRLESHGVAANEITVVLRLETGAEFVRTLRLPYAGRDAVAFLKLLQLDLAAHPPDAPILGVAVKAQPVEPRRVQNGLFLPQAPEGQKLELTLARLRAVVGEMNVGSAELVDSHRPGAFRITPFILCEGAAPRLQSTEARLAMRVFRPPLAARVVFEDGRPRHVAARGVRGKVTAWAGPWRTSGEWWQADFWARDEWDVALATGALYRVYRTNTAAPEWFIEGNYD